MKGRKPNKSALNGALDKTPPTPAWLPKFAKTKWARVVPAQAVMRAIYDYAEAATGNREYFWDRPVQSCVAVLP